MMKTLFFRGLKLRRRVIVTDCEAIDRKAHDFVYRLDYRLIGKCILLAGIYLPFLVVYLPVYWSVLVLTHLEDFLAAVLDKLPKEEEKIFFWKLIEHNGEKLNETY